MSHSLPAAATPLPASGQVHLWLATEPEQLDEAQQRRYAGWLDHDERVRWQRFHIKADQQCYLLAHALVRSVLAGYLQQSPEQLRFTHNRYGKPELDHSLQPRLHALRFNLSHTRGLIALAVTVDAEVGVDVEATSRKVEVQALADRFFAPSEASLLRETAPDLQRELFFRLWTLKEAYVKARGLGLQLGLESFAFSFDAQEAPGMTTVEPNVDATHWSFFQYQQPPHFRVAVAVQAAGLTDDALILRTTSFDTPIR